MIKINLLSEERGKKAKGAVPVVVAPVAVGEAGPVPVAALVGIILVFALATLGLFGWYYFQNSQLEKRIKDQQAELKKYEEAKKRVDELNKKKEEFQAKLDKIQELKNKQPYPVLLMNKLMEVLPEGVWYTSIGASKDGMKVEGKARGLKTVSTFYDNAVAIPDLVGAEKGMGNIKQDTALGDVYSFAMTFKFIPGGEKKQEEAAPADKGKKAPAKGKAAGKAPASSGKKQAGI
ncbi:MAG: hypothetical protein GYA35_04000 [Thermoanaerobaculaceae bacterium]|nr:hypothetical protein [Thermoanaerobaculaceae bacterium]